MRKQVVLKEHRVPEAGEYGECEMTYTLHLGDCLPFMRDMAAGSVDAVIADPPYDKRTHVGAITTQNDGHKFNNIDFGHLINHAELTREFLKISKRWCLAFCTFEDMGKFSTEASKTESWVRAGVWDRVNPAPQFTGDRPSQAAEGIAIFHTKEIKKRWNGKGSQGIWRFSVESGKKEHPTQKPLSLMMKLISQFTDEGETVFDPFMGSGTTGVACMKLGRNFIGCEISSEYYAIAERRIEQASRQVGLFDQP